MKVALVHDYLKEIGGAERVLMALKEIYPEATIYTAYKFPGFWGNWNETLSRWEIKESWGRWLPFLPRFISYYTVLSPWFFGSIDLSSFELVIVSQTGAYFPNGIKIGKNTKLVTYCHTPPRFLYGYPTATKAREKWFIKPVSLFVNVILRNIDFRFARAPHMFIANSNTVKKRIEKFYRRQATVVYPPVEAVRVLNATKEDYYLVVSRIVGSKNVDLAIEAAKKYGFKLKIAGRPIGQSGQEILDKISGENIEYLGEVDDQLKASLMAGARGFLALETDADFGITPVEAQMQGTPVVAFRGGGYEETVIEGKTGVFFDELSCEGLYMSIKKLEKLKLKREDIMKQGKKFGKETFQRDFKEAVASLYGFKNI
jgi:glycosyltransferase involved in cell wall biosynthesis